MGTPLPFSADGPASWRIDGKAALWLELALDRLSLSAQRPPRPLPWIAEGTLSVGQAQVLVGLAPKRPLHLARRIRRERLTVRPVEAWMRPIRRDPRDPATVAFDADPHDPDHPRFEDRLSEPLGVPVTLSSVKSRNDFWR